MARGQLIQCRIDPFCISETSYCNSELCRNITLLTLISCQESQSWMRTEIVSVFPEEVTELGWRVSLVSILGSE